MTVTTSAFVKTSNPGRTDKQDSRSSLSASVTSGWAPSHSLIVLIKEVTELFTEYPVSAARGIEWLLRCTQQILDDLEKCLLILLTVINYIFIIGGLGLFHLIVD